MEFSDDDVLNFIEEKLSTIRTATPALFRIERALITSAWRDPRRTYREIAEAEGYSQSYVHNVATELWDSLSNALGTRVRKPNMKEIVSRCILEEQQPSSQAAFTFRKTAIELQLIRYRRTNKSYTETLTDEVKLTLMLISAGEFMMGASENEPESRDSERPQHRVKVLQFLMGRYPITKAQWQAVASYGRIDRDLNPNPSQYGGKNRPVENVSWEDAIEFCNRLSLKTGKKYQLPSEAQWEYACRAGTDTPFHFGETLITKLAN